MQCMLELYYQTLKTQTIHLSKTSSIVIEERNGNLTESMEMGNKELKISPTMKSINSQ